jgi:hypothetical protein
MNIGLKLLACASLVALGGCATVIKGTTQDIAVETNPPGATCTVSRNGAQIATLSATPGKVQVSRDKSPIMVSCAKAPELAAPVSQTVESKFNGATFGNILAGGVIGVVVDASTGANYTYPEQVMVSLTSEIAPVVAAPVVAPAAAPLVATAAASTQTATAETAKPIVTESGTITMKPVAD